MITIIIPYFQKETGVLARALRSIAAQQPTAMPMYVIVVDDASPISAESELAAAGTLPCHVEIIHQANGGPGAARNTGLNHAPVGTRYIAFLDSDDEWCPEHAIRATESLGAGYAFYFADHRQLGAQTNAFARAGRIQPDQHPLLPVPHAGLHAYQGDLLDQIIRGNIIGTSTVVYDFQQFSEKRFKIEFTNAGEDYLFWMDIADSQAKVAFSSHCEVIYGRGVNIFAGTAWGSEQHMLRTHNEIKYKKLTGQLFKLTELQKIHIQTSIKSLRTTFAQNIFHRILHRKKLPWDLLKSHMRLDPLSFVLIPVVLLKQIMGKNN